MNDLDALRGLARAALAALEASRQRIDDLNVYPVPDGDTGTNMTLTVRGIVEALDASQAATREELAKEVTRAALLSARGNSGVILSQIVRGAAESFDGGVTTALRGASDAAYSALRTPVEGTMLTVIRELAEAAEQTPDLTELVRAGEESVARTPDQLDVLRDAGVVDAGGAGLVEILRGIAAHVAGEPLPEAPAYQREIGVDALHLEPSRYRYCTTLVVEGDALDATAFEEALDELGDSVLVVGDAVALKLHVHTDEPDRALSLARARGTVGGVEIADMHLQTAQREERLKACEAVVVSTGAGNRRLFEDLGAGVVIDGGRTMNPATQELVDAIERSAAPEAIVLPNNPNVLMAAEQAAAHASKPVRVIPTRSIQEGLAALVAYDPTKSAETNMAEMLAVLEGVTTGAVTVASRDAAYVKLGQWLGLVADEPVAAGDGFDEVTRAVLERLLEEPRDLLTFLTGEEPPPLDNVRRWLETEHPDVEVEVEEGGQPSYPLLVWAE